MMAEALNSEVSGPLPCYQVEAKQVCFSRRRSHTLRYIHGLASRAVVKGNCSFALLFFKTHRCHQWDQNGFWCCTNVTKASKSRSLVGCGHSFDTREDLMNIHHFCPLPQYIND